VWVQKLAEIKKIGEENGNGQGVMSSMMLVKCPSAGHLFPSHAVRRCSCTFPRAHENRNASLTGSCCKCILLRVLERDLLLKKAPSMQVTEAAITISRRYRTL